MSYLYINLLQTFILFFFLLLNFSSLTANEVNDGSGFGPTRFKAELLARASHLDSFALPDKAILNNVNPLINNRGDVCFKVLRVGDKPQQGLWFKEALSDQLGRVAILSPEEFYLSDPSLNDDGKVAFTVFDENESLGLFLLDTKANKYKKLLAPDKKNNIEFFTYPTITNKGDVFFRGTDRSDVRALYRLKTSLVKIIEEGESFSDELKASYLFRPGFNDDGQLALKMRLGNKGEWNESNPDVIAFLDPFKKEKKMKIVAVDRDFDSQVKSVSLTNFVGLSNKNQVVYQALLDDGRSGIFMTTISSQESNTITKTQKVVLEGEGDLTNIEKFPVKVNGLGHIIFRGVAKDGKRSIFFYNGTSIKRIISEGETIDTDKGSGMILHNQFYPGFSGEIDINDQDEIVFSAVLVNAKNPIEEWGQGVFKLSPLKDVIPQ